MREDFKGCEIGKIEKINESDFQELSELLGVLSNRTRLAILAIALNYGEVCTCRLQEALGLPQPTITVHLHKMYSAGILDKRESWRYTYYSIKDSYKSFLKAIFAEKFVVKGRLNEGKESKGMMR